MLHKHTVAQTYKLYKHGLLLKLFTHKEEKEPQVFTISLSCELISSAISAVQEHHKLGTYYCQLCSNKCCNTVFLRSRCKRPTFRSANNKWVFVASAGRWQRCVSILWCFKIQSARCFWAWQTLCLALAASSARSEWSSSSSSDVESRSCQYQKHIRVMKHWNWQITTHKVHQYGEAVFLLDQLRLWQRIWTL